MAGLACQALFPTLPLIGLGTAANTAGSDAMRQAVSSARREHGIALFDLAQNYGSEADVGWGLRNAGVAGLDELGRRIFERTFILAKVDLVTRAFEDPATRVRRQVGSTLKNLEVDRLDAVVVHWPICLDAPCSAEEHAAVRKAAWRELEALVDRGVIRHLGVSNWTPELLDELLAFAKVKPLLNEVEVSPVCPQHELLAACAARGVAVVAYSPYGACWLATYLPAHVPWGLTPLFTHEAVVGVAAELGCTPAQVLLRYSVQRGVTVIPKSVNPQRIGETVRVLDDEMMLSEEQMARLDALEDPRRGTQASIEAHLRVIAAPDYEWQQT